MSVNNSDEAREVKLNVLSLKNVENKPSEEKGIQLLKKKRVMVFILITFTNIFLNMDHGTIPAASNEIKQTLNINETTLGTFGSLVYLGNLIGALFLTKLIDVTNRKLLAIVSTILNGLLIYLFTITSNIYALFLIRVLIGIMQSFITVYFPVWVDQFGMRSWKTVMMSIFNITSPLGVVIGYILTMTIKVELDWKVSYSIQVVLLLLLSIVYFAVDDQMFDKNLYLKKPFESKLRSDKGLPQVNTNDGNKLIIDDKKIISSLDIKSEDKKIDDLTQDKDKSKDKITVLEESFFINQVSTHTKETVFKKFCDILKVPVYTLTCVAITTLLFISTAVIFWASDFGINVLKGDNSQVLGVFVVVCITGPVAGIIIGGAIVQKYAGGYEGKHSITFSFVFAVCAFVCSIPIRWVETIYEFGAVLWAVLFFGGSVIPNIQGIMISSLDTDLRAAGNSVSNILQSALGFLPAPFLYGLIYDNSKNYDKRLAMTLVLWYSLVGIICIGFAMYFRFQKFNLLNSSMVSGTETNRQNQGINIQKINLEVESNKYRTTEQDKKAQKLEKDLEKDIKNNEEVDISIHYENENIDNLPRKGSFTKIK